MSRTLARIAGVATLVFLLALVGAMLSSGAFAKPDAAGLPVGLLMLMAMAAVPVLTVASVVDRRRRGEGTRAYADLLLVPLAGAATFLALLGAGKIYADDVKSRVKAMRDRWEPAGTLVMTDDAKAGTVLTYELVAERRWPGAVAGGSTVRGEDASMIVGQTLLVPVKAGEPLRYLMFSHLSQRLCPEEPGDAPSEQAKEPRDPEQ